MTVSIIYGWPEGNWHGKAMRQYLRQNGYEVTANPQTADVIIAHSAGCFLLPQNSQAKLVLLIGMPLQTGQNLAKSTLQKIELEPKDWWWLKKSCFNTFYLFTKPVRWIKMNRAWNKPLPKYKNAKYLLICNLMDAYMDPDESQNFAKFQGWSFKTFEGQHDDLWQNPKKYVDEIGINID